jgi:LAO/AO transport system kinase
MDSIKTIARNISFIENRVDGFEELLLAADESNTAAGIIGITGAPGTGKSTLVDGLIQEMINHEKKVAVLCVDPSSPFNMGALLGDRIRMSKWYNNENVFIRSMASRKALGGLSPMIIEVTEYLKTAGFDYIIVETVGVGQNEIDVAGLADITIVVMVPEGGDEIQTMKSGIMEIGDIFVVNKCDRPEADRFVKYLHSMLAPVFTRSEREIPVIKTVAEKLEGIDLLYASVIQLLQKKNTSEKKYRLLAERAYQLIQSKRMNDTHKEELFQRIMSAMEQHKHFNLYHFIKNFVP